MVLSDSMIHRCVMEWWVIIWGSIPEVMREQTTARPIIGCGPSPHASRVQHSHATRAHPSNCERRPAAAYRNRVVPRIAKVHRRRASAIFNPRAIWCARVAYRLPRMMSVNSPMFSATGKMPPQIRLASLDAGHEPVEVAPTFWIQRRGRLTPEHHCALGRPTASRSHSPCLANYALHYVGGIPRQLSADYFGEFSRLRSESRTRFAREECKIRLL